MIPQRKPSRVRGTKKPSVPVLFEPRARGHGNVVLNFTNVPEHEYGVYADAYHRAGRILVRSLRRRRGYSDPEGAVVFFLYRHACELYLKGTLLAGKVFLPRADRARINQALAQHRLSPIAHDVVRVYEHLKWGQDETGPWYETRAGFLEAFRQMDAVDGGSFAFRYPNKKDGKPSLGTRPKREGRHTPFLANVLTFAVTLDGLLDMLSASESEVRSREQEFLRNLGDS